MEKKNHMQKKKEGMQMFGIVGFWFLRIFFNFLKILFCFSLRNAKSGLALLGDIRAVSKLFL